MNSSHPLLEKLEELFHDEPFDPIEEELFKWLMFVYTGKGNGIKDLDSLNFEAFKGKLNVLIDAVYEWHKERK
jgi:hypothetical protein